MNNLSFNPVYHTIKSRLEFEHFLSILDWNCPLFVFVSPCKICFPFLSFCFVFTFNNEADYHMCCSLVSERFVIVKSSDSLLAAKKHFDMYCEGSHE